MSELRRKFPSKTGIKGRKETGSRLSQSPDNTKREKNHRALSRKCPALSGASAEPLKLRTLIDKGSYILLGFPGSAVVKNLPADATDLGLIPELGRSPGEGNGNPPQYSLPGESHGQRSLAGYSPWGHKELEIIERLTVSLLST